MPSVGLRPPSASPSPRMAFRGKPSRRRGSYLRRHVAEADAVSGSLTPARYRDAVAVFEEASRLAAFELQRPCALPGQLEHAAVGIGRRPTYRPARQQIARPQIAAVDGVMRELLGHVPVQMAGVRCTDSFGSLHP